MAIKVHISGDAMLGEFDLNDDVAEAYIEEYVKAVFDALRRTYPDEDIHVRVSWSTPCVAVDADEDVDPDSVLEIANDLWNHPSKWFAE